MTDFTLCQHGSRDARRRLEVGGRLRQRDHLVPRVAALARRHPVDDGPVLAAHGFLDLRTARKAEEDDIGGGGDLEWFGWFFDQGFMPWEEEMRQMELFAKHIIPAFR